MTELIQSWVISANSAKCDFPLNNLPYCVFSSSLHERSCGVAIGDSILNVSELERAGKIDFDGALVGDDWCQFMALGKVEWLRLRSLLTEMLLADSTHKDSIQGHLVSMTEATLHMPFTVAEFTDFYSSQHHATNVGTMFRGAENALPPNWLHIPIGYNGRASSVVVSGTDIVRPHGQLKGHSNTVPRFAPSARFDIELGNGGNCRYCLKTGPLPLLKRLITFSDTCFSMTGRHAIFRLGNTSHWVRSKRKQRPTTISPWIVTCGSA